MCRVGFRLRRGVRLTGLGCPCIGTGTSALWAHGGRKHTAHRQKPAAKADEHQKGDCRPVPGLQLRHAGAPMQAKLTSLEAARRRSAVFTAPQCPMNLHMTGAIPVLGILRLTAWYN